MLYTLVAKWMYWTAQAAMPLGRIGARLAHRLLLNCQFLDPRLTEALAWQYLIEGSMARQRGDSEQAVHLLREASAILPQNDVIIANLGIALATAGRHDEAIDVIERAIRGEADLTGETQVWVALVWSYLRSGRAPKALEACKRAEESQASGPDCKLLRVLAQGLSRGFVQRDQLSQALRVCPRMLPMVLELAQHLANSSSHDMARQIVRCLREETQAKAYQLIATSALNSGELATSLWALKQLEAIAPNAMTPPMMRAEVCLRQGDIQAAQKHAGVAVARAPHSAKALEQLARTHVLRGEWTQAAGVAREAVAHKSTDALIGGLHAVELIDEGNIAAARKVFLVGRSGDALSCAYGYAAQALVFAGAERFTRALDVAEEAMQHVTELPEWAAQKPVVDRVTWLLSRVTEMAPDRLNELDRGRLDALRQTLAQERSTPPAPTHEGS